MSNFITAKVVAVGDTMCGKTALLTSFNEKYKGIDLINGYVPNVLEFFKVDIKVGSKHFLRKTSSIVTDVFFICFSIDNPDSLKNIAEVWAPEIKTHCPDVPIILIGTKIDLRNDPLIKKNLEKEQKKIVEHIEIDGHLMAKNINAETYVECSVKTKQGIEKILKVTAEATLKKEKSNNSCQV